MYIICIVYRVVKPNSITLCTYLTQLLTVIPRNAFTMSFQAIPCSQNIILSESKCTELDHMQFAPITDKLHKTIKHNASV